MCCNSRKTMRLLRIQGSGFRVRYDSPNSANPCMCEPRTLNPAPSSAGFSFIEVMVVVVIIGLLAGAVAMRVTGYVEKAKEARVKSDLSVIVTVVEAYHLTNSQYPGNEDGLDHLTSLKNKLDPWGRPYQYNSPGPRSEPFEVMTFGADGREGGEGENADVYSWQLEQEAAK